MLNKLSAMMVSKLSSPGDYGDGGGLWLQVSRSGSKSWTFRFTLAGRSREMGLGPLHTVSLGMAREKALQCRGLVAAGTDPITARDAAKAAQVLSAARHRTFDQCAAAYIKAHRGNWKSAKHAAQWESTLAAYASSVFGSLSVADIDTELVVRALRPIWESRTETATRLRGRIECILDWATVSEYRQGDNPARWRGHLENLLANPKEIERSPTSPMVVAHFLESAAEVAAGVKQQLEADAAKEGGLRLLDQRFMVIQQAMGVPKSRGPEAAGFLAKFVEEMKARDFVADALERHNIKGASVAPA